MIRVATPADADAIARVHVATWQVAYAGLVPDAFLAGLSIPANAARWESLLADPARRVWVAVAPEAGVEGFVAAGPARDADVPADHGEIYALYVLPSAHRRGTGRRLAAAALAWIPTGRSVLWVVRGNAPARAFYAATGWTPDGTERESDIGGALVREVRYRRSIPAEGAT